MGVTPEPALAGPDALLDLYDDAVGEVYAYLARRCDSRAQAEDLTSETFLAAVAAVQRGTVAELTVGWLITVARRRLVDHWRRQDRERRRLEAIEGEVDDTDDRWDAHLDALVAHEVLRSLAPQHRAALTLRYFDGLPVADVARALDRTTKATEVLLVRARRAFRAAYDTTTAPGGEA